METKSNFVEKEFNKLFRNTKYFPRCIIDGKGSCCFVAEDSFNQIHSINAQYEQCKIQFFMSESALLIHPNVEDYIAPQSYKFCYRDNMQLSGGPEASALMTECIQADIHNAIVTIVSFDQAVCQLINSVYQAIGSSTDIGDMFLVENDQVINLISQHFQTYKDELPRSETLLKTYLGTQYIRTVYEKYDKSICLPIEIVWHGSLVLASDVDHVDGTERRSKRNIRNKINNLNNNSETIDKKRPKLHRSNRITPVVAENIHDSQDDNLYSSQSLMLLESLKEIDIEINSETIDKKRPKLHRSNRITPVVAENIHDSQDDNLYSSQSLMLLESLKEIDKEINLSI